MSSNAIGSTEFPTNDPIDSSDRTLSDQNSDRITLSIKALTDDLQAGSLKNQLRAIRALAALGEKGELALIDFVHRQIVSQQKNTGRDTYSLPTAAHGSAYQCLYQASSEASSEASSAAAKAFITEEPYGVLPLTSAQGIDYKDLQILLVEQKYQLADQLTMKKLCELAGESAIQRKWVYFTEVSQFPTSDLQTIDMLWGIYSEDKFGWSKQRELWLRLGQDWERLWTQLNWKTDGAWTRYPNEFIWDLSAPTGHLPLSNQLRGVRMMDSLLSHPAWTHQS